MSITGQRIKERRKQLEMSADDIAIKLGVSRSTVFRYENGRIEKVPANVLEKLAEILKTTPSYLMGWQEDDNAFNHLNLLKESIDESYHTDEKIISVSPEVTPVDRERIIAMTEIYLTLTSLGKRKVYDYMTDISEQTKYIETPSQCIRKGSQKEVSRNAAGKKE